jgi:4-hydroxyproline epimerase
VAAGERTTESEGISRVHVIDSHTEGEPTRVVVHGGPDLGTGPIAERRDRFRARHDSFRRAIVGEPRGGVPWVGALLCPPTSASHSTGIVFFNRAEFLGMCGHGTIGVVATLAHLGRVKVGRSTLETPVGDVAVELAPDGRVAFWNVPSYRSRAGVRVEVPGYGPVVGDVAWGGNWFFLIDGSPAEIRVPRAEALTQYCWAVRKSLEREGITGTNGAPIDHIELSGPPERSDHDARNFVLCPDGAYDRSPCGTGTSAKMACLVADGRLAEGRPWRQEGILGGVFEGVAERVGPGIVPRISGRAFLTAESDLLFDPRDPFREGSPS